MTTFSKILAPLSTDEFLKTYWDKRYLHVPAASRDKYREFPSLSEFPQLFNGELTPHNWDSSPYSGNVFATWSDGAGQQKSFFAPIGQAASLFNAGASICYGVLTDRHPTLTAIVEDLTELTSFHSGAVIDAYLTPPHSGGPMHFDSQHVFFLQTSGEKYWRISQKPAIAWPPINLGSHAFKDEDFIAQVKDMGLELKSPEESEVIEVLLKEGDLLYLPPGFWHEPKSRESHSLHYSLGLTALGSWHVINAYLRLAMLRSPEWRRDLRFLDKSSQLSEEVVLGNAIETIGQALQQMDAKSMLELFRGLGQLPREFRDVLLKSSI